MTPIRFRNIMLDRLRLAPPLDDSREMFQAFDTSDKGYISVEDFRVAVRQHSPGLSARTIEVGRVWYSFLSFRCVWYLSAGN